MSPNVPRISAVMKTGETFGPQESGESLVVRPHANDLYDLVFVDNLVN